jgi:N-dimethylarginine dimethylaminohydrolase
MSYGCQSETGKIERLILKHPKDAFRNQDYINANWKDLNYIRCPDYEKLVKEFEFFTGVLENEISDIYYLPPNNKTGLDSIYTHDPALISN